MIKKLRKVAKDIIEKAVIEMNEFSGFTYVRNDRGAREFVASSKEVWDEAGTRCPGSLPLAFASGRNIYWPSKSAMYDTRTLKHELSHVEDHEKLGIVASVIMYAICDKVFGYEKNPFEMKARMAEREY